MNKAVRLLPIFLLSAIVFNMGPVVAGDTFHGDSAAETRGELEQYFEKVTGLGFSGAVLVAKDNQLLLRNGYGWADEARGIPITPDTVFDIGSITKVFTSVAIMQLVEQGKIRPSDPISKYFPNVPTDKSSITVHLLLTHTSGFSHDDFYSDAPPSTRRILINREKFIQRMLRFPLAFAPGTKRLYSNTGFSFLAAIVEKLSGKSYEQYLRDYILTPAGMTHTGYVLRRWNNRLVARGYNDGPTDYGYPWTTQWAGRVIAWDLLGNGGLLSTIDDMHKFVLALRDEKLLQPQTMKQMFTVYYADHNQAYGWFIYKTEQGEHVFINHGGDAVPQGWNADLRWFKDDGLIAIVLTNKRMRAGSIRRYAMNDLVDITLFGKSPQLPEFADVSLNQLREHQGVYELPSGSLFQVGTSTVSVGLGKTKPVLIISGRGQEAIDLLFSGNQLPGLTKLSLQLNDKTKSYIEALSSGDLNALKAIPSEEPTTEETLRDWHDFEKRRGALSGFEILGTSPMNQTGVQTFVRLDFGKRPAFYHLTWRDQKLHVQDEDTMQQRATKYLRESFVHEPLNLAFLPQSNVDFATYDPFKARTVKVTFTNNKLIVHTKTVDVVAERMASASSAGQRRK